MSFANNNKGTDAEEHGDNYSIFIILDVKFDGIYLYSGAYAIFIR